MDYYEILEVSPASSTEVIKMAYKALVKKYHPDVYKGDKTYAEEMMKKINEAYDVLSDPVARTRYDQERAPKNVGKQNTENSQKTSPSSPPSAYPPQQSPQRSQSTSRNQISRSVKGCFGALFDKIRNLIGGILAILITYGMFTGTLMPTVSNLWEQLQDRGNEIVNKAINIIPTDESRSDAVVKQYLNSLKNADTDKAVACIKNDKLDEMTRQAIKIYQYANNPTEFGHEMIKEVRKFQYKADRPSPIGNENTETVDVQISVINLYSVTLAAITDYNSKMADEDWVNQYIAQAVVAGQSSIDETAIFEDCINRYLHLNIKKLVTKVQFTLKKYNGKWYITDITDRRDFGDAVIGNFTKVEKEFEQVLKKDADSKSEE